MQILRNLILLFLCLFLTVPLFAQGGYLISQQPMLMVQPVFQNWEINDVNFHETSVPVFVYYPINRIMSVNLQTNQATASGDYLESLSGLTDTQIGFNYHLEEYNLVFNLGLNLPSGKNELTPAEFYVSSFISANQFNFRVPNFGQGFNFAPGVTWARAVNDQLVIGSGLSFQYKGGFKPVAGMPEAYKPGSELLLTLGLDYKLSETAAISGDIIFINYGSDKSGDNEVFKSGNMLITNLQIRKYVGYDEIHVLARYRSKGKNEFSGIRQESPNQAEAMFSYRKRLSKAMSLGFIVEVRSFERIGWSPGIDMRMLGLAPTYVVSRKLTIPAKFKYGQGAYRTSGLTMSGYEIGIGCQYLF